MYDVGLWCFPQLATDYIYRRYNTWRETALDIEYLIDAMINAEPKELDHLLVTTGKHLAPVKEFLVNSCSYRFDTSKTETPSVGDYSTVRFDKNNYSVPVKYLRKDVTVKGYANTVHIYHKGVLIATHDRAYGKNKTEYRLEHYIDLLERKPRAV